MKTTMLILLSVFLVSCTSPEGGGETLAPKINLEDKMYQSNWRTTVSCVQNQGCEFKAIIIHPDQSTFTVTEFTKADVDQDGISTEISNESYDLEVTGTRSGIATSRIDPNIKLIWSATDHSHQRMTICVNSDCRIYDQLEYGDL